MYSYLSETQKLVIDSIEAGNNIFVTGAAGTGKSYLLHFLREKFKNKNLHITATTGIAAVNVGGITLHSWANLGKEEIPVKEIAKKILSSAGIYTRKKILNTDMLAIDEVSMLSKETFENLDLLLRLVKDNDRPFGGIQILLFGDFFQLPPVNSNNFCFESEVWNTANIKTFILKDIFRQEDKTFINILNNIRHGFLEENDKYILKNRLGIVDNSIIKPTILSTHNIIVEKINFEKLNEINSKEITYTATFTGENNKIELLKRNCLAKEFLTLKLGSQVMMLKNTYQKDGIINGSTGIIIDFSPNKHYPIVEFTNGKIVVVKPEIWEIRNFNYNTHKLETLATMSQIPLTLSWAITVHKSQGMTIDKAEFDLKNSFAEGQVYVAFSRVKNINGIFIKSLDLNKIKINEKVLKFYKKFENF